MTGDGGERTRTRTLIIAVTSALVTVGVFVLALRLTPAKEDVAPAASTGSAHLSGAPSDPGSGAAATPSPQPATPAQPSAVPQRSGPRFEQWVYDVARWLDIPQRAMHAYAVATVKLADEQPDCRLSWVTLAGIGKTTTDHGRAGGGTITDDGTVSKPIATIEFRDFAGKNIATPGAAGPMQLSPAVWQRWQAGTSGTTPNVQDIDDAALTVGRALCSGGRDLARGDQWLAAVSALHPAPLFLHRVLATANVYGTVGQHGEEPDRSVLAAVSFAIDKIGLPYVWGGNGREHGHAGFDCSGLTTAAYARAGIELPRTAHWQYNNVRLLPAGEQPQLGDLIFYGNPATKIHHVGIYIGNQQMIDAPTFGQAVQVHNYRTPGDRYAGAGRPAAK